MKKIRIRKMASSICIGIILIMTIVPGFASSSKTLDDYKNDYMIYQYATDDPEILIGFLSEALQSYPKDEGFRYDLITLLMDNDKYKELAECTVEGLIANPNNTYYAYYNLYANEIVGTAEAKLTSSERLYNMCNPFIEESDDIESILLKNSDKYRYCMEAQRVSGTTYLLEMNDLASAMLHFDWIIDRATECDVSIQTALTCYMQLIYYYGVSKNNFEMKKWIDVFLALCETAKKEEKFNNALEAMTSSIEFIAQLDQAYREHLDTFDLKSYLNI